MSEQKKQIRHFSDLIIWQRGRELVTDIYASTSRFPAEEKYGLASQMRRSSLSIPSNIAEGFARYHRKEFAHFLSIALGSCFEIWTQVIIAGDLKMIQAGASTALIHQCEALSKMINALLKKLKQ